MAIAGAHERRPVDRLVHARPRRGVPLLGFLRPKVLDALIVASRISRWLLGRTHNMPRSWVAIQSAETAQVPERSSAAAPSISRSPRPPCDTDRGRRHIGVADDAIGATTVRVLGIDTPEAKRPGYIVGCGGPERFLLVAPALRLEPNSSIAREETVGLHAGSTSPLVARNASVQTCGQPALSVPEGKFST